mmetsp:Transcript_72090/g.204652  ORF Transcript_72090/g.204652 Transcript_72090/m.204652 type:complete len:310 (-) Transcript_72090:1331-2260(-)
MAQPVTNQAMGYALGNMTEHAEAITERITEHEDAVLLFFMLLGAQIVLFMQAGFAMLEVGLVGHKNAKSILFKNLLDMCVGAICWWCVGFGVAGAGASGQAGRDFGISSDGSLTYTNSIFYIHSLSFAATTCTIMSGGVAERMRLEMYIACAVILVSLVYPIVIGWGWDSGQWLCGGGFVDFAGSCLVHVTGGICALLGAALLGPRRHRFLPDGTVNKFKENSVLLAVLGCLILTFWCVIRALRTLHQPTTLPTTHPTRSSSLRRRRPPPPPPSLPYHRHHRHDRHHHRQLDLVQRIIDSRRRLRQHGT